jgi:uncharacterized membrane protein YoaK (UPF0700 family)
MRAMNKQTSESLVTGVLLAVVGGFLDAYTYITRGHVFANAQTGNMVLLGTHFSQGRFLTAATYLFPIFAFFLGVLIAELIKGKYKAGADFHWRLLVLGIEMVLLIGVAFIPESGNIAANVLVSFVCAMQVETFRKVHGSPYATTMCTGNLRSATENLHHYLKSGNEKSLSKCRHYGLIILTFISGAVLGAILSQILWFKAVLVCPVILGIVFILIHFDWLGRSDLRDIF